MRAKARAGAVAATAALRQDPDEYDAQDRQDGEDQENASSPKNDKTKSSGRKHLPGIGSAVLPLLGNRQPSLASLDVSRGVNHKNKLEFLDRMYQRNQKNRPERMVRIPIGHMTPMNQYRELERNREGSDFTQDAFSRHHSSSRKLLMPQSSRTIKE